MPKTCCSFAKQTQCVFCSQVQLLVWRANLSKNATQLSCSDSSLPKSSLCVKHSSCCTVVGRRMIAEKWTNTPEKGKQALCFCLSVSLGFSFTRRFSFRLIAFIYGFFFPTFTDIQPKADCYKRKSRFFFFERLSCIVSCSAFCNDELLHRPVYARCDRCVAFDSHSEYFHFFAY